jgi:hypothetical protein
MYPADRSSGADKPGLVGFSQPGVPVHPAVGALWVGVTGIGEEQQGAEAEKDDEANERGRRQDARAGCATRQRQRAGRDIGELRDAIPCPPLG